MSGLKGAPARFIFVFVLLLGWTICRPIPVKPKAEAASFIVPQHAAFSVLQRHFITLADHERMRRAIVSDSMRLASKQVIACQVTGAPS